MKHWEPPNDPASIVSNENERTFWGIHVFREAQDVLGCMTCGWGPNDPVHAKPEE